MTIPALHPGKTTMAAKACCTVGLATGLLGGVVPCVSEFQRIERTPTGFVLDRVPNFVFNPKPIEEI